MTQAGFHWSIAAVQDVWTWRLTDSGTGRTLMAGAAPSRALAAALVARAIARGMTSERRTSERRQSLAA